MAKNAIQTKKHYDAKCKLTEYKHGDLVWHPSSKLQVPFEGPYFVLDKISDQNYCIQLDAKGKHKVVNHDNLNLYTGTGGCPGPWLPSKPRRSRGSTVYKPYLYVV